MLVDGNNTASKQSGYRCVHTCVGVFDCAVSCVVVSMPTLRGLFSSVQGMVESTGGVAHSICNAEQADCQQSCAAVPYSLVHAQM
jgi:hypothetical protein